MQETLNGSLVVLFKASYGSDILHRIGNSNAAKLS